MKTPGKKPQRRQNGRIAFIASRDDIRAELERGATMIAVYDVFAPRLGISYVQFTRYVNADIRGKPPKPRGKQKALAAEQGRPDMAAKPWSPEQHAPAAASSCLGADDPARRLPRSAPPRKLPEFHYDPMDAIRHRRRQK